MIKFTVKIVLSLFGIITINGCKGQGVTDSTEITYNKLVGGINFWSIVSKKIFEEAKITNRTRRQYALDKKFHRTSNYTWLTPKDSVYAFKDIAFTLDSLIAKYPKYKEPYRYRIEIFSREHKYDSAIYTCNNVINLFPHYNEFYYSRGNLYFLVGRKKEAIRDWGKSRNCIRESLSTINNSKIKLAYLAKDATIGILLGENRDSLVTVFMRESEHDCFSEKNVRFNIGMLKMITLKYIMLQTRCGGIQGWEEAMSPDKISNFHS